MQLQQFFAQDDAGNILPGAYAYLYLPGTTTLASGLQDASGNALDNPLRADSSGFIQLAAPNGDYDLRVTSGGLDRTLRVQFLDLAGAVDTVTVSLNQADQAASRAETARDAAQLSAGVYADTAAGLAATAEGDYFSVPSASSDEYLILYRHDPGVVAPEIDRYPSKSGVDSVKAYTEERTKGLENPVSLTGGETGTPLVTDNQGNVALSLDSRGALKVSQLLLKMLSVGSDSMTYAASDFSPLMYSVSDSDGRVALAVDQLGRIVGQGLISSGFELTQGDEFAIPFAVTDVAGRVAWGIGANGEIINPTPTQPTDDIEDPTIRHEKRGDSWGVDINHFIMNGQSLSVRGGDVVPVQDSSDLVFSGGLKLDVGEVNNTFIPMKTDGSSAVIFNAMQQMKFLMSGSDGYTGDPLYSNDYTLLASSHGYPGAPIENLIKGGSTTSYEAAMLGVDEAVRLSSDQGKSYAVQALSWIQGESNRNDTAAEYITKFLAMIADYRSDIMAKTGQPNPFKIFTYQPSGNQAYTPEGQEAPNTIAQAFFELSEQDSDIIIVTPTYCIEHQDALHPTWPGSLHFGLMWGKALYKTLYRREGWRPLEPRRIDKYGSRVIVARFHVPEPPLVFDTTNVTDPGNFGFDVRDDVGVLGIVDIEIVGTDAVRITVDRDIGLSPELSYAYYGVGGQGGGPLTGTRGNLRDSDPTVGVDGSRNLWNWCTAFSKPIAYVRGQ